MESRTNTVGVVDDTVVHALREILFQFLHRWRRTLSDNAMAFEPGDWKIGMATAVFVV